MIRHAIAARIRFVALSARVSAFILLLVILAPCIQAQQDAGATTPSVAPGGPAGSYALSGFETVNPYNGNLNFNLPLMQVGGRGTAGYTMTLPIETRWRIDKAIMDVGTFTPIYQAFYTPLYNTWYIGDKPGYGPGKLLGRTASYFPPGCDPVLGTGFTLMRLSFVAADGTEYELRDQSRDGQPWNVPCSNPWNSPRGQVFKSADGTAVTFISDTAITDYGAITYPSGYLMMRDGTRYRIDSGDVTWIRDRNGNKVSFIYDGQHRVTTITDSINRQITINYYNPPTQTYDRITYIGYNNLQREIRVYYAALSTVLRSDFSTGTMIFPPTGDSNAGNPSGTNFDTTVVVSQVLLPNNQSYFFKYSPYLELSEVTLPTGGKYQYDWVAGPGTYTGAGGMDGEWGVPTGWPTPFDPSYTGAMYAYRRVTERRVRPDGSTLEGSKTYSVGGNGSGVIITVNHLDASSTLKAQDKHYYYGTPFASFNVSPTSYASWKEGREYQSEAYNTSGALLRRVAHTWQQRAAVTWWTGSSDLAPPNDPRITDTTTTLADVSPNPVTKQTFSYDRYNNPTDVYEYDYGSGSAPTYPKRYTHTDYLTTNSVNGGVYDNPPPVAATDTFIHLRSLPRQQIVYAVNPSTGAETWAAQTVYEYDKYTGTNHAALVNRTNISGLDSGFTTSYQTRGNVTQVDRWRNSSGTLLVSNFAQYDIAGNSVKAIDGRGNATTLDFTDRFGAPTGEARANSAPSELAGLSSFAFATKVDVASGTSVQQTSYVQFDYHLGRPVDSEDPNGVVSSAVYNDSLDRPTQVIRANTAAGDPKKNQTTFLYTDASRLITTKSDQSSYGDNLLKSEVLYDGLGRTSENRAYETSTAYITAKTNYDALGRVSQVSNPYRSGDTVIWTTTAYDALSRVISVTTPDGAAVNTYYNGAQVLVKDPASKYRLSQSNTLGQLTDVWEITSADGATECIYSGCASFPGQTTVTTGYRTKYVYDALNNLTTVTQQIGTGGTTQTRSFVYDPLKRLTSATNPESGAITYQYDDNGNLTSRTDARSITTTINYDAVNRPTTKTYSDTTPGVAYFYDNQTLPTGAPSYSRGSAIGREVAVTYGGGSVGNYYGYDTLGRVTLKYQRVSTTNYQVQASYNLAGAMTSETYPSGRTVSYSFDTAGRLNTFSGTLGDGTSRTYASITQYSAAGMKERESYGTGTNGMTAPLYLKLHYNKRQQMVDLRLGSVNDEWNWNRGALIFYYGTNAVSYWNPFQDDTDNNGNVRRALNYVPTAVDGSGNVTTYVIPELQDYTYDALNRIQSVTEAQMNAAGAWTFNVDSQTFGYDRYGNRGITAATGGVNNYNPSYTQTNNHISNLDYDYAGNLLSFNGYNMNYDAENRMVSASGAGGSGSYVYDGEGKRVKRITSGQEWWYIYGLGGEMLAEYLSTGPTTVKKEYGHRGGQMLVVWDSALTGDQAWKWLVQDHLGSNRMEEDKSGSLTGMKRHDYLPFGEELTASVGAQRSVAGVNYEPPASNVRQKFTGKERDLETGLDFFEARYYASIQGRFNSADPLNPILEYRSGANSEEERRENEKKFYTFLTQPQRWNSYSYVINNPLVLTDPDGRELGYYYAPDGRMIAPGDPNYPRSNTPITDTLLLGGLFAGGLFGGPALVNGYYSLTLLAGLHPEVAAAATALALEFAGGPPGSFTGPAKGMSQAEKGIVDLLRSEGRNVERLVEASKVGVQGVKTADFLVNGLKVELKTLEGSGPLNVLNAISKAVKQAPNVILDARGANLTRAQALEGIQSAFRLRPNLNVVRVVGRDFDITITRGGG